MLSSDSEGFESADEGHSTVEKSSRKKRLSSSEHSDKTLINEQSAKKPQADVIPTADGWDDFEIEEDLVNEVETSIPDKSDVNEPYQPEVSLSASEKTEIKGNKNTDTGWDDFDDWGDTTIENDEEKQKNLSSQLQKPESLQQTEPDPDVKSITDRLVATSTKSSGWGWGWGVDSLLSTASAGITTLTNQVSQGISTVLESGIGAPDPEELAKQTAKENEARTNRPHVNPGDNPGEKTDSDAEEEVKQQKFEDASNDGQFPFGSILSGVTKFVESTGTKVLTSGLDTLETIGKKTMEVLQDGDPGLVKKRAMLGLDAGDKPVLSQVLREAKAKAEEEDRIREEKREAKEVHYENLFDDFEGLVHLEALEMLSRQISMRIEERLRSAEPDKRHDIKETLQQVAELCEIPEDEDDEDDAPVEGCSRADALHERLQRATQDIGLKLQFQPLINQYTEILSWRASPPPGVTERAVYKRAVSGLAQATSLAVQLYHKTAEMLLVKPRRSTADESDALAQMTVVLTRHISELATIFTEKLNSTPNENKEQINTYITNIFLEAGNSSTYIQNAFQLVLPILQIGAV